MIEQGDLRQFYTEEASYRSQNLYVAFECARMSVPSVLPRPTDDDWGNERIQIGGIQPSLQSIGARGATSIASGLALTFAPPGQTWFSSEPKPDIEGRLQRSAQEWREAHAQLKAQDILAHGYLEAAYGEGRPNYHAGFLSRVYAAMLQLVVTGDALVLQDDDLRMRIFPRNRYVTVRDSDGFPRCHVTLEWIDPLDLSEKDLASVKLDRQKVRQQKYRRRLVKKYTAVMWDGEEKRWTIWSEIDGHVVGGEVRHETISPYISVAWSLNHGVDNYGHGIIEQNLADLTSLESMEGSRLNILANAGRLLMGMDVGCNVDPSLLANTPNGGFVPDLRVEGGQVQDVAPLTVADMRDFAMLTEGVRDKREDLGRDLMIETEMQPEKDRVTATQINRIAQELQGRWGPMLISNGDQFCRPLATRSLHVLHKKNRLNIPGMLVPFKDQQQVPTTGVSRLFNDQKLQRVTQFVQTVSLLGPEAARRLNVQGLMDTMKSLYELDDVADLTRSEEEIQEQDRQQAATEAEGQIAVQQAAAQ